MSCENGKSSSELLQCEVLQCVSSVEALSEEWERLLNRSICNRAFSCPTWYLSAIHSDGAIRPCVLTARRRGALAAVLPLAIKDTGEATAASLLADYNDIVAAPEDGAASAALLQFAWTPPKPYQRVSLWRVRQDSMCVRACEDLVGLQLRYHREGHYSFIDLTGGYHEYLQTRSGKFRRVLAYGLRKAARAGVTAREIAPSDLPAELLPEVFLSLHLERLNSASVFQAGSANDRFVRTAFPDLFIQRRLRAFGLWLKGALIAVDIAMEGYDGLCLWNGGYRAAAAIWSPGRLLLDEEIRFACERGFREHDLSRGVQDWKTRWANATRIAGRMEFDVPQ